MWESLGVSQTPISKLRTSSDPACHIGFPGKCGVDDNDDFVSMRELVWKKQQAFIIVLHGKLELKSSG